MYLQDKSLPFKKLRNSIATDVQTLLLLPYDHLILCSWGSLNLKPQSHRNGLLYGSLWFDLDHKTKVNHRKSSISMICKGSTWVSYTVCMVFVWFLYGLCTFIYEFMTMHGSTTVDNKGKSYLYLGCSGCRYGMIRRQYDQARSATGSYDSYWFNSGHHNGFLGIMFNT